MDPVRDLEISSLQEVCVSLKKLDMILFYLMYTYCMDEWMNLHIHTHREIVRL